MIMPFTLSSWPFSVIVFLACSDLLGNHAGVVVATSKVPPTSSDANQTQPSSSSDSAVTGPPSSEAASSSTPLLEKPELPRLPLPALFPANSSPVNQTEQPSLLTLLESNSSGANLLELSDAMLANASSLIESVVNEAHPRRGTLANGSLGVPRLSKRGAPVLKREEETIKELADHSGKLQRLFEKLEKDLAAGDYDYGADSLDAHGPVSHAQLAEDTIDWIPEDKPAGNLRTNPQPGTKAAEVADGQQNFRLIIVGLLVAILISLTAIGFCLHARSSHAARGSVEEEEPKGNMQYVIRIVKARIVDLPSRTALAWQISVAGDSPRPSRFTNLALWDAPVDRLDLEVSEQREKISVEILQQSETLGPPTTVGTVEIPAGVLLAEANKKREKVISGGEGAFCHEKKLALYPRGELVLEYSLIAFFHWYVNGEEQNTKQI